MLIQILLTLSLSAFAATAKKQPALGKADAPQGGTFYQVLSAEPETLNPITSQDTYGQMVESQVLDGLLTLNADTYEWEPGLAEKWEVSKDGMTFTFFLRKDAKFHDGKPVTADDVKFSFDYIQDDKFKAVHKRPYFENFSGVTIVDPYTVKFNAREKYFNNLNVIASGGFMPILPKHVYGDPQAKVNKLMVGSGAYKLDKYDKSKGITLKRNKEWWGNTVYPGANKFDEIYFRFVKDENTRLEMIKKGQIDYDIITPEAFVKKAVGEPWGKSALTTKTENLAPKAYGYVAWNLLNPMFQDKNVRVALAMLMNRELMNEKFRYGLSVPATGPWYQQNPYANKDTKAIAYDPKKAGELLAKAGWKDEDKNGILEKTIDGKKVEFKFSLLLGNRDNEKYMTMYKEDLKKAGIDMEIKNVEFNSLLKAVDEKKFDSLLLGWTGGSVDLDPKQIWHTDSAKAGGSNFISYSNKDVDKLIDKARKELDKDKRIKLLSQVYQKIADDAPYAFLFNEKYVLYANTARMKMEKPTYKYDVGTGFWWVTP